MNYHLYAGAATRHFHSWGAGFVCLLLAVGLTGCGEAPPAGDGAAAAPARSQRVTPAQAREILQDPRTVLVDVRTPSEYQAVRIPGAHLVPHHEIARRAAGEWPDKETPLIVYCRTGGRSVNAAQRLVERGYRNVYDLGGISRWDGETVRGP